MFVRSDDTTMSKATHHQIRSDTEEVNNPITFKSNDNHQSKGRVMTELLYIRIFNKYARKDTKERTRLNPIKSPVSPLLEVSPLLTRKNSAKLKTQFPLLRILLT